MMVVAFLCHGHRIHTEKQNMKSMIELVLVSATFVTTLAGTYKLSDCSKLVFIHNTSKSLLVS
jgi:hypothetical protein